jgi:MoaA/NifB/PqqE/SkfB family radical SAM enzyme
MNINRKLKIFKCALQSGETPFASIFVTRRCNMACSFCNVQEKRGKELTTAAWKRALKILHGFGVRNVSFNGGEPLLREDIGELIDYASMELGCITWLFSNLTLLTDAHLETIKQLDFICASLDGLSSENEKSDPGILQKLKRCYREGITPAVLATITGENVDQIYDLAEETVRNNILFDFNLIQNVGGLFSSNNGIVKPARQNLQKLFKHLSHLRAKSGKVLSSYKLLREASSFYKRNNWKCPANKNPFIVVNDDGRLMPCQEFASDISIFDVKSLNDEKWKKAKKEIIDACRGCSWTSYYQKTFRNPFDLLQESVALLKF